MPAFLYRCTLLCCCLLLAHGIQILGSTKAAVLCHADHAHAHKSGHCACRVSCSFLHGIRCRIGHSSCHHKRIGTGGSCILHLVDLLHISFSQRDRIQGNLFYTDTSVFHPFLAKSIIHCFFQFIYLSRDLCRTKFLLSKHAKGRLQCIDKFTLQLVINLISGKFIFHIAAQSCIETQRIRDHVGIQTVAAYLHCSCHTDTLVGNLKHDRICGTEFISNDFFGIKIVHSLILTGISSVSKTLSDRIEGTDNTFLQFSGKERRFGGCIICKFTRFCADFNNLSLINDDHALTIRNNNA